MPLAGKVDEGTELTFEGVADSYTASPFMVVFDVDKDKLHGWTGKNETGARTSYAPRSGYPLNSGFRWTASGTDTAALVFGLWYYSIKDFLFGRQIGGPNVEATVKVFVVGGRGWDCLCRFG